MQMTTLSDSELIKHTRYYDFVSQLCCSALPIFKSLLTQHTNSKLIWHHRWHRNGRR